LNDFAAIA
jgi:hypothetical protein